MSLMKINLAKGVTLNVINTDLFKSDYMSVSFALPLSAQNASKGALLPLILTRGTVAHPTMASISEELDMLYASTINTRCLKKGEVQFFGFNLNILNNRYAPDGTDVLLGTLNLLHEVIFQPLLENGAFVADYLETEKENLCDRINAEINNKISYAVTRAKEEMCKNEAYGVNALGTVESVMAVNANELYKYYKSVISDARVEIFFVGQFDEAVEEKIRKALPFCDRTPEALDTRVIRRADGEVNNVVENQPVTQSKLSLGFRTGKVLLDGDYYKFVMFNEVYGGSPSSKLFMNVREKLSLCYYCRSIPEPQKGVMIVTAGIETENKQLAQDEILAQLKACADGNITEEELEAARKSVLNAYKEIYDNPEGLESWYTGRLLAGLCDSPEEAAEKINNVGIQDIVECASAITLDTVYFMKAGEVK